MTPALDGIRVVTTAPNVPGPVAVACLRALGASVLKVERSHGDALATFAPAWYAALHEGIGVVRLELERPEDRAAFDAHLAGADVLVTSSRPAALERLGLAWSDLHRVYPRVIHVAIVGRPSPRANDAGHDLTYQAEAGLVRPPHMPPTLLADLVGAERAVAATLAALLVRERTGVATYVEVSLAEAARDLAAPLRHGLTTPGGFLGGAFPHYGVYRARDGWVAVANVEPHFRQRFERELGIDGVSHDELARIFATRDAGEWEVWGAQRDLPIVAVVTPS